MNSGTNRTAFTLVELLVVVAIIVVLLALLVPGMERAIYQSELAVCAAQQKTIVTGGQQYAMSFLRYYPHRFDMRNGAEPENLYMGNPNGPQHDLRKTIKGFIDLKPFVDPLCKKVDLSANAGAFPASLDPNQIEIHSSYNVWFDAQYNSGTIRYKGMFKMGDRFVWRDPANATATEYSFNLLVNDRDSYNPTPGLGNEAHFSHPDDAGKMFNLALQDGNFVAGGVANDHVTISFWRLETSHERGLVDGNYGYDDGSVIRHTRVGIADDRMVRIPEWMSHNSWGNGAGWGTQVPKGR